MKMKDGFVLRKIADQYMAVPIGARAKELHGMIGLNETGAFIWERLSGGLSLESIVQALCETYEVDELCVWLEEAGFTNVRTYGDCRMSVPREDEQRIYFTAIRK